MIQRRLTTLALSFAVMCVFVLPAVAQTPDEMNMDIATRMAKLKERLQLTDPQVEQLKPVVQEEVQKMKAITQKYEGDTSHHARHEMSKEIEPVRKDFNERIEKILDKDQMKEWNKIKKEREEEVKKMLKT